MALAEQSSTRSSKNPIGERASVDGKGAAAIAKALNALLADSFALYLKTKNFHWHVVGPNFRPYHLLFEEHAEELFDATDELAARAKEIDGATPGNVGEVVALRRVRDAGKPYARPQDMLGELMDDNNAMAQAMRDARGLCERHEDQASAGLLDTLIDQTERRILFLDEVAEEDAA